jgi:glycosyltransferase involved in cell wall biosynthesis
MIIEMHFVSIIVPNYNHSAFLRQRLDSILAQTYRHFELIILDDNSTDNSREIIESYRNESRVSHIVYNVSNSGNTFHQWKKGIELATGEYVWVAESDDFARTDFLMQVITTASETNAGVVYSDSMIVDDKSEELYRWSEGMHRFKALNWWINDFCVEGSKLVQSVHALTNVIPNASSAVFQRKLVNADIFDQITKYRYTGDWIFWSALFQTSDVAYIHQSLNYFRSHFQTTRSVTRARKPDLEEYYRCLALFKKNLDPSCNEVFMDNLAFLFQKWHYSSPVYFVRHWSRERYELALAVDPLINKRILKFILSSPAIIAGRLFRKTGS